MNHYLAMAECVGALHALFTTHPEPEAEPVPDVGFDGFIGEVFNMIPILNTPKWQEAFELAAINREDVVSVGVQDDRALGELKDGRWFELKVNGEFSVLDHCPCGCYGCVHCGLIPSLELHEEKK